MSFPEYLRHQQQRVDQALDSCVPAETTPPENLHRAMRYSLFAGGKRLRPVLFLAAAEAVRPDTEGGEAAACSLELIHTYSLIHDDLPALDNDDLRRGLPTCHKVFGESMAILAGDALLTLAFQVLSQLAGTAPHIRVRLIEELSKSAGTVRGMIAGQVHDIEGEGQQPSHELLESIHRAKTGALLRASVRMGAIYAGATDQQLAALSCFGEHAGLAFQIVDDILDIEESPETLGKTPGKDAEQHKVTFPAVYGLDRSRSMAEEERTAALRALAEFGDSADRLREIADVIVSRRA